MWQLVWEIIFFCMCLMNNNCYSSTGNIVTLFHLTSDWHWREFCQTLAWPWGGDLQPMFHPSIHPASITAILHSGSRGGCWRPSQLSCGRGWGYTCGQVDKQSSRLTPTGNLELPTWPNAHVFGMLEGSRRESAELKEHRETRRRTGIEPSAFLLWGYGVDHSRKSYCHCSLMHVCPISFPSKNTSHPLPNSITGWMHQV